MIKIKSKDGTEIAVYISGQGPALIAVHGSTSDHTRWVSALPWLNQHFTLYAIDRRGRGASSDGDSYSIEREYEDIAAVAHSISGMVNLLGHSYGGICSIGAVSQINNLHKLVLYEAPIAFTIEQHIIDDMQNFVDANDREAALKVVLVEVFGQTPEQAEASRSQTQRWESRVANIHTVPRELQTVRGYNLDTVNIGKITVPTLLLLGGSSLSYFKDSTVKLEQFIKNSRVVILEGQGHNAMDTIPEMFVQEIAEFLASE